MRAVVLVLLLLAGLLALATAARVTHGGAAEVDRLGTATVAGCTEHGPVSVYGIGTTYRCMAEVRWSDGTTEQREFPPGQLSPADTGPVPVYLDLPDHRGEPYVGRNDSAWYSTLRLPILLAVGGLVLVVGLVAGHAAYRVIRPAGGGASGGPPEAVRTGAAQQRAAHQRKEREWPLTPADRAGAPLPRITVRLWLLAAWCLLLVLLVPVLAIPRFDAPRAVEFVSPWPQVERALLVDPPATGTVVVGLALGLLLLAMAAGTRTDAARTARYGPAYLARNLPGKSAPERRVRERLDKLAASRRRHLAFSLSGGLLLLALAVVALVRAVVEAPAQGSTLVWLACVRDAVLLGGLAAVWLGTVESPHDRMRRLLAGHQEKATAGPGTAGGSRPS
ncbi:hypothetical protein FB471_6340 [Amycolatopsis cihanbeyliensis]|uniref:DUF3592 domain-containing protein n=1 Tax=Amycolatopsis cihanbeyliensis TaxID=1128664 RepID=A0A542CTN0_AMYCI|nr:hypothetical protein FB471_6340 [Amycolatopsis cihanbeyliensis]